MLWIERRGAACSRQAMLRAHALGALGAGQPVGAALDYQDLVSDLRIREQHYQVLDPTIPLGLPLPAWQPPHGPDELIVRTGDTHLGANHWMNTTARLTFSTGRIVAQTRTWSNLLFGGFHGGVYTISSDDQDISLASGQTPMQRYGVDGRWIGQSDRTDVWVADIDPTEANQVPNQVQYLPVFQSWAPNDFQTILDQWVASGKNVAELAGSVAAVAKVFTATKGGG